jgi:SGNH hydrolase-like domain, acetyltransferase AlgX
MFGLPELLATPRSMLRHAWAIASRHGERNLCYVFLGLAALCLVAPLLQTLHPVFGTIGAPLEERRAASPFPALRLLGGTNGDFAAGLNKWFDDRVGFRDLFIRAKNQIDYTLFDTSKKVWIGSDGWLFDRFPAGFDLDDAQLSILEKGFVTLAHWLGDRDIHLIVVGYPDKSVLYPEMAPARMPLLWTSSSNYGRFRQFLASRSEFAFIDAEEIMKREKSHSPENLYQKADMHVTEVAQILVVKEIVAQAAQAENRLDVRWDEKLKLSHVQMNGGGSQARLMALMTLPVEEAPYYEGHYTIGASESDGHWNIPDPRVLERADRGIGRPFDFEFRLLPELCASRLPGMVLFGNSFSDLYWSLGLQRYFCFIRRAREPVSRFKLFYDAIPADTRYFILEYYEPWLLHEVALFKLLLPAN